jgi:hypothetical protein
LDFIILTNQVAPGGRLFAWFIAVLVHEHDALRMTTGRRRVFTALRGGSDGLATGELATAAVERVAISGGGLLP